MRLAEQDRSRWDRAAIAEGLAQLAREQPVDPRDPFELGVTDGCAERFRRDQEERHDAGHEGSARRHPHPKRGEPDRGEYYEMDSNAHPVGSKAWWDLKARMEDDAACMLVIVGATALELGNRMATPLDPSTSGPMLQALARQVDFRLKVVGSAEFSIAGVKVESRSWNARTEVDDLKSFDE